jgi:hypothetical protein
VKLVYFLSMLLSVAIQPWGEVSLSAIHLVNRVSSCLAFKPIAIAKSDTMVVTLSAEAVSHKSTGECGCRSALLRYRVVDGPDQVESVSAVISTLVYQSGTQKDVTFVLSGDGSMGYRNPVTVTVDCAQ